MPESEAAVDATRAIRQLEAVSGGHTPIIGITAHALKGDREDMPGGRHGRLSVEADFAQQAGREESMPGWAKSRKPLTA